LAAQTGKDAEAKRLEREILSQLIEINTSDSAGHTDLAARAYDRLIAAGLPAADVQCWDTSLISEPVARYRGRDGSRSQSCSWLTRRGRRPQGD
jgi:hypothetical protein